MSAQLSVVVPTFKRSDSLERLIDHLHAQQGVDIQIVVVDQNEPGYFSGTLLEKLQEITWVHQPTPNASLARNNGFGHATAPYILFLDDDLVPEPTFCAEGLAVFQKYNDIKSFVPLVYSHLGKDLAIEYGRNKFIKDHRSGTGIYQITETISASVFFERSYYLQSGGFDELLFDFAKTSEDLEFFLRMRNKGMELWLVPSIEIFHDEKVTGGCELRTAGYWNTRQKCLRALALRYRIHKAQPGELTLSDRIKLARSSFLNKKGLTSGVTNLLTEIRVMNTSIRDSRSFFEDHKKDYATDKVDFIKGHVKPFAVNV